MDLLVRAYEFNITTSPADFLRALVQRRDLSAEGLQRKLRKFGEIYAKIKSYYVAEDIKHEEQLERRREELARLVLEQKMTASKGTSGSGKRSSSTGLSSKSNSIPIKAVTADF